VSRTRLYDPDCTAPLDEAEARRILDGYLAALALAQLLEGEAGR
jgi:hypothetical protein